jgi:predicted ribosomally synthesized peptide with nif11-like leader
VSQEKAHEFIRKAGTEKSFSDVLAKLKSEDDLLNAAKSLGYDFTIEELRLAIVRIMDLADADLGAVTGGAGAPEYGWVLSILRSLGA